LKTVGNESKKALRAKKEKGKVDIWEKIKNKLSVFECFLVKNIN